MKRTAILIIFIMIMSRCIWAQDTDTEQNTRRSFTPGQVWLDTDGNPIQAHGGGVLVRGDTYYWYGEDRTPGRRTGVSCYSSTDLYNWKHESVALPHDALPDDIRDSSFIERPKVIYNSKTGKYIMWMHLEQRGYHYAQAGIAVSDKPAGPFVFTDHMRPVKDDIGYNENDRDRQKEFGGTYRDMNMFVDDNGKAYAFYASEGNATMYVVRLNDEYTGPEKPMARDKTWARILIDQSREAPAPFKYKDRYYVVTSGCTGWRPNEADYAIADNILGPWEQKGNPCTGPEAELTFRTQSTCVFPVIGKPDCYIFMADRWTPRRLDDSRYIWLPLIMKPDGTFTLEWQDEWDLSVFDAKNPSTPAATTRTEADFDFNWLFEKGNFPTAAIPEFDDSGWRKINLPHDWSIEEPFGPEYGSGNGYAPGGVGWYRKHFTLDEKYKDKLVSIQFDGVYNNSEVWINGHLVGRRPFGYISFAYDVTQHLKFGAEENIIAVRVDHSKFADSRWYTGSGIYRHVHLCITDKLHIGHWGTFITTPKVENDRAVIRIETTIKNAYDQPKEFALDSTIVTADGRQRAVLINSSTLDARCEKTINQEIIIDNIDLWSLESPTLYTLKSKLNSDSITVDETTTPFGIRTLRFDPDKGFFLNGKPIKLKGVCLHHDAGCLGAAVPDKVLERRLRLMKELGANAIRTSHNPPAPELLELCDRMGLLVKDEAFDEFTPPKNKWVSGWNAGIPSRFGYGEVFEKWSVVDIEDMVRRDRNHPSIIMWSIGNEIDYSNDPFSHPVLGDEYRPTHPPAENLVKYAEPLIEAVKKLDTSRPVTAALANIDVSNAVGLAQMLDVVGYNYQENKYEADHNTYPDRFIFGSENGDAYDAWTVVRDNDYVAGQFLWTGIDYLGEARRWPNRANGSGLLDMCGYKKQLAWFRQSLWSEEPMVYICVSARSGGRFRGFRGEEHWNWPDNATVSVICYTNCSEVSLALNDKPLETKNLADAERGALIWQIPYEPGTLKAKGMKNGDKLCEYVLRTAGPASRIEMSPDVTRIQADGKDICHLEFRIVDDKGVCVPDAENELAFEVDGPASIIGIENGNLNSIENPKDNIHKAYRGRGLAILQSSTTPGRITVSATSPNLESASVEINAE